MAPESDSAQIAARVRNKIAAGALPSEPPMKLWAGPGTDLRCAACDLSITAADIEDETEHSGRRVLRFHQACFTAWDAQRVRDRAS
jgi:hypothetical protein